MRLSPLAKRAFATGAAAVILLAPLLVSAAGTGIIASCALDKSGKTPGLDCVLDQLVLIGRFIFGIMGSLALLMFVVGGTYMLASGGRESWVKKGKSYITNAVIGIFIIVTSAYLLEYAVNAVTGGVTGAQCTGQYMTTFTKNADGTLTPSGQTCCNGAVVLLSSGEQACSTSCSDYGAKTGKTDMGCFDSSDGHTDCVQGLCGKTSAQVCCSP